MTTPPASSSAAEATFVVGRDGELPWLQRQVRGLAAAARFEVNEQWAIATAVTEAVTNMLKYGGGGELVVRTRPDPPWLEFEAHDRGPGIPDVARALEDGVSEGQVAKEPQDLRRRRGLGLGLGAIRRLMDEVEVRDRPGGGLVVVARKVSAHRG